MNEFEEVEKSLEAQAVKDNQVLDSVKALLSDQDYENVINGFKDCMHVYDFAIVDEPEGEDQLEEWEHGSRFCDQWCGYAGDDYQGNDFIPLPKGKYFRYRYTA